MKKIYLITLLFVFTRNIAFGQMDERFYHPDKEWIEINSSNYEEIILHQEQDTVFSLFLKPDGKPKATILYFHGNGSNNSKWASLMTPFINDGFQVCMLDYRGYGKSTGKPTHLNIATDAQALLDILLAREDIKEIKNIPILFIHSEEDGIPISGAKTVHGNVDISCRKKFWTYEGKHLQALSKYPQQSISYINDLVTF